MSPQTCPTPIAVLVLTVAALSPSALAGEIIPMEGKSCPSPPDIVQMHNWTVFRAGNVFRASMVLDVQRPVTSLSKVVLKLVQCPVGGTCKQFYTMRYNRGVCNLLTDKTAFWAPVFSGADPPMRCPFEKRRHYIRNATVAMEKFLMLFDAVAPSVTREAIWTAKLDVLDDTPREWACVILKIKYTGGAASRN